MEQINETQQQYEPTAATPPPPAADNVRTLHRTNGPISGVSGGLAEYFDIDAALVRLAIVAGTLVGGPIVPIGYIAAWIIIPEAPATNATPAPTMPPSQSPVPVDTVSTPAPMPAPAPQPVEPAPPAPSGS